MTKATIKREAKNVLDDFFNISVVNPSIPVVVDAYDTDLLSDALAQTLDRIFKVKIKYNDDNESLYCTGCKRLIALGEKYIIIQEECLGELIEKVYSWDCAPEDSEELYIPKD